MSARAVFASFLFAAAASAQRADDIGLWVNPWPMLPVSFGQECGPVTCTPSSGATITPGDQVTMFHLSAPTTPFVIAVAAPGPCVSVPGIANPLLLGAGLEILEVSITSSPPFAPTQCNQGIGNIAVQVPFGLPSGLLVRVQSLGWSVAGVPAFGPAVDLTVL